MATKLPATFRKLIATRASNKFRDVVSIATVPTPQPGEGEVLVKNKYVGINASDINFSAGRYDPKAKFPLDCGFEAVGEVVSTGPKTAYKPGQALMYCQYGAFSDFKLLKANTTIPLPDVKAEYLPFILSGNTAAISLDKVGELKPGETVLVTAAAGGTGQIAVQWAKLAGCHVIGTCSTPDKVQFLKVHSRMGAMCPGMVSLRVEIRYNFSGESAEMNDIGCDRPINYKTENLRDVLSTEYPKGVDVVYESIGGDMFDACVENLAVHGRLIIIGYINDYSSDRGYKPSRTLTTLPPRLLPKSASVRGFFLNNYLKDWGPYVMKQLQHYQDGKLKVFVDKGENTAAGPFIGLEKVCDAVEYLYSQKSKGKIIVELNSKLKREKCCSC